MYKCTRCFHAECYACVVLMMLTCSFTILQTTFVDCLVSQTHPEIEVKDDKDVSTHLSCILVVLSMNMETLWIH